MKQFTDNKPIAECINNNAGYFGGTEVFNLKKLQKLQKCIEAPLIQEYESNTVVETLDEQYDRVMKEIL